jgi:sugar lactone lactonase YvrE
VLDFGIDKADLRYIGNDLQRPECILAEPDGVLWVADARGGVMRIAPDGSQNLITQRNSALFETAGNEAARYFNGTLPNGLAFTRNGEFLISNFGTDCLEVMSRDGSTTVLADHIDGQPIGKVNFVLRDSRDRVWITVSTRVKNWMHALRTDLTDGFLARYDDGVFRIVADGFQFTNEIRFDADEEWLYVVETAGGRITRLRIDAKGDVRTREIFGPSTLGTGAWPDGIAFDTYGNLWWTLVYSDKLFVITPQGDLRVLLDEGDPTKVAALGAPSGNAVTECAVRDRAGSRPCQRYVRRSRSANRPIRFTSNPVRFGRRSPACRWCIGMKGDAMI